MFNHIENYFPLLPVEEVKGIRYYRAPSGALLPSVTSVLGAVEKPEIIKWRAKVGEKKSEQIRQRATDRGHIIHDMCEAYLKNEPINKSKVMPYVYALFLSIKPYLNKISDIRCLETCLYSEKIGIAGRVDCIGVYDDLLMVMDFKGSTKVKTLEQIPNYCMQACAYSLLYEDMSGIHIDNAIIIMAVEQDKPLIFKIKTADYKDHLLQLIADFYKYWYGNDSPTV